MHGSLQSSRNFLWSLFTWSSEICLSGLKSYISLGMMRYSCNPTLRVSRFGDQGKRGRGSWRAETQQCLNQPNLFLQVFQVVILRAKLEKKRLKRKKHVVLGKPVKKQKPGELGILPSRVVATEKIACFRLGKQSTLAFRTLQEKS